MKNIIFAILLVIVSSCDKNSIIYFYPEKGSGIITIIDKNQYRYIIKGKHEKVPDLNYIKLDISKVDKLSDVVYICWKENELWEVTVDKSVIVETVIDTANYKINTTLPRDSRGIPTENKFKNDSCMIFSYYLMRLTSRSRRDC
ncbi:hypothetical protein [Fulvivirga ligni]|uniref:hypothetical protein n=1 Tax=Fulvivirga ligni TaxID=2904246 RepID=UPI001F31B91D|nr:hypothetical protein [Fulvivirga ligni]UII21598.1 hypothetical protein LVD16_27605 [Fulvivirga ligni]